MNRSEKMEELQKRMPSREKIDELIEKIKANGGYDQWLDDSEDLTEEQLQSLGDLTT
jgi:hypothetical protein